MYVVGQVNNVWAIRTSMVTELMATTIIFANAIKAKA